MAKLNIFYRQEQTVSELPIPDRDNHNRFINYPISPSTRKPKLVLEDYLSSEHSSRIIVNESWEPLQLEDFFLAHDKEHARKILNCKAANGFGNTSKKIADSLYFTNGSFLNAAIYAYENKCITMSPTSGFHHAGYNFSEGFCTFNGLMISAIKMTRDFGLKKISIVDYDAHYGNGTDDIIKKLGIGNVNHISLGKNARGILSKVVTGKYWVDNIQNVLEKTAKDSDVIFYQAGADPHINDPFGGLLTTEDMLRRDEIVFKFANENRMPIVWNLAGGYQEPVEKVIGLHRNTLNACMKYLF